MELFITKVLGIEETPHLCWEKIPNVYCFFFLSDCSPNGVDTCLFHTYMMNLFFITIVRIWSFPPRWHLQVHLIRLSACSWAIIHRFLDASWGEVGEHKVSWHQQVLVDNLTKIFGPTLQQLASMPCSAWGRKIWIDTTSIFRQACSSQIHLSISFVKFNQNNYKSGTAMLSSVFCFLCLIS